MCVCVSGIPQIAIVMGSCTAGGMYVYVCVNVHMYVSEQICLTAMRVYAERVASCEVYMCMYVYICIG